MSQPFRVYSTIYYLTDVDSAAWRQSDYNANKAIKAVKGEPINKYFTVRTTDGKTLKFTQDNANVFLDMLYASIGSKMKPIMKGKFSLVPIPNSSATVKSTEPPRTFEHAKAIAEKIGDRATAIDALRWKVAKVPAHKGGSRDPQVHFENLRLVQKLAGPVILFDDMMTTGGQMIAAYRRLAEQGITPIAGIVIGRTTKIQHDKMLGWVEETLETEDSPLDWGDF